MLSALQGQPGTVTLGKAFLSATSMQKVLSPLSRPPLEHRSKGTGNSLFCAPRSAVCCDPSPHRCPTHPDFPLPAIYSQEDTRQGARTASQSAPWRLGAGGQTSPPPALTVSQPRSGPTTGRAVPSRGLCVASVNWHDRHIKACVEKTESLDQSCIKPVALQFLPQEGLLRATWEWGP